MLDPKKNFSIANIVGDITQDATTIHIQEIDRLPSTPGYNAVIWDALKYSNPSDDPKREIIRVTGISGSELLVERGQENTDPQEHMGGNFKILAGLTKKDIDDIDTALDYMSNQIQELNEMLSAVGGQTVIKGEWDASSGSFPPGNRAGWTYIVTTAGTVDGVNFTVNDRITAIVDNASSTTYAGNWQLLDYQDSVQSVNGQTGIVTLTTDNISEGASQYVNPDEKKRIGTREVPTFNDLVNLPNEDKVQGKIYVTKDTNKIYRYENNVFNELSPKDGGGLSTVTIEPEDDWQSQCLVEAKQGLDFFGTNNVAITEFATPNECKNNTNNELSQWNSLMKILYQYFNSRGVPVGWWAFGHEGGQDYSCNVWAQNDSTKVWEDKVNVNTYLEAIQGATEVIHNYAGNEFYVDTNNDPPMWGSGLPDSAPKVSDFEYFRDKGVNTIRYPIGQPASGGRWLGDETNGIDDLFIGHIERVLNRAQQVGIKIILDVLHPGDGSKYGSIFGHSLKTTDGMNGYKQYALALGNHSFEDNNGNQTTVKEHPALRGIEIMNEPHSGGTGDLSASDTESITQEMVNYWRNTVGLPISKRLYVPTHEWSGLQSVTQQHSSPWISDVNFSYVAHYYPIPSHNDGWANGNDEYIANTYSNAVAGASAYHGQGAFDVIVEGGQMTDEDHAEAVKRVIPIATKQELTDGVLNIQRFLSPKNFKNAVTSIINQGHTFEDITITHSNYVDDGGASAHSLTVSADTTDADTLIIRVACRQVDEVMDVTFNGVSVSQTAISLNHDNCGVAMYVVKDPTKTTADVVVTMGATDRFFSVETVSLKNVAEVQTPVGAKSWGTEAKVEVTTPQEKCMVLWGFEEADNNSISGLSGLNYTTIHEGDHPASNAGIEATAYTMPNEGTLEVGYNISSGSNWAILATVLVPKVAEGTAPITKVEDDTNPKLGGDLDANKHAITITDDDNSKLDNGLKITSEQSAPGGSVDLVKLETTNSSWNRPMLRIIDHSEDGGAANIRIDSPNGDIEFVDTSETAPAGKYEIDCKDDALRIQGRNSADNAFERFVEFWRNGSNKGRTMELKKGTTSETHNMIRLTNLTSSSGAQPGIAWYNEAGDKYQARISAKAGSGYANAEFIIEVADENGDLQKRLTIDKNGTVIMHNLPTASSGLPSGALYRDPTDNSIKQVP